MLDPAGPEPSDRSLVRRLRVGDQDAAAQLYVRYAERLRYLALRNQAGDLCSRVDPDDIVQSVFRIFFEQARRGRYHVPDGEDLWKLLLVLALNKLRSAKSFHHAARRDTRLTTGVEALEHTPPAHGNGNPFAASFLEVVVEDALEALPPQHRRVVELRIEGYEVAEISDKTGRARRTVERVLQESRRQLRDLLLIEE